MSNTFKIQTCNETSMLYERIFLIALTFLSYFLFKNLFFKENAEIKMIKEEKIKKSMEYLETHKKENEDFFFGSEEN
jgi:hypothetical protein